ncbi:MAG TPA: type II CAAX endopeptidase family protein [Solirubrobacterales bacterium]|nr:type II CAAX endopeptidase family protein [Solirubrobacterales bacterium]
MGCKLKGEGQPTPFPYSSWGPMTGVLGVLLALATGAVLSVPAVIADSPGDGDLSDTATAFVQLGTALGFLLAPFAIAAGRGASVRQAAEELGLRRFQLSAVKWMFAAVGGYLGLTILYVAIAGAPEQEDIAEAFGTLPVQILLIAIAAPISEEVCFRGFLFGGLRRRLPRVAAALVAALVFGALHATTGISAVPPLIAFGFVLCLLYEKTGSIVPGIILHVLNNSVAMAAQ